MIKNFTITVLLSIISITFTYASEVISSTYASNSNCELVIGEPFSLGNSQNITVGFLQGKADIGSSVALNNKESNIWKVTPIPVKDFLNITPPASFEEEQFIVSLYAITGSCMFCERGNQGKSQINISTLPAGVYILKIQLNDNTSLYNLRIIKL